MPRILLVEDDGPTRHGLSSMLTGLRHDVRAAGTLTEAIEMFTTEPFDLVISDIDLPDGTGWELGRFVTARKRLPAIAMSGSHTDDDVRNSLSAGFAMHLAKPLFCAPLVEAIDRALTTNSASA